MMTASRNYSYNKNGIKEACYDGGSSFRLKYFLNEGAP